MSGIVLECKSIEATFGELEKRGGLAFTSAITKEFWGTFAAFSDSDGNGWILSKSAATAAASRA